MSGWDYWKSISGSLEAASSHASKLAEVVTAQVSEQSKAIAAQASTYSAVAAQRASEYSKVAAENAANATSEARAQLAGLQLPEALSNLHFPSGGSGADVADQATLERFCITPDLCSFVRSMTYATFRDFPQEEVDKLLQRGEGGQGEEAPPLNMWQANHAKLICVAVQEINELRFVLVPKMMDDAQFWAIYFALNRNRLPPECFDTSLQQNEAPLDVPPPPSKPSLPKLPTPEALKKAPEALKKAPEALKNAPEALKKEFRDFKVRPAARESDDREGDGNEGEGGGGGSGWLCNLLNGFDMEIPTGQKLEQDTVLLGALHSRLHQLSEGARGIRLPNDMKHNITANLNNVRDLLGLPHQAESPVETSQPSAAASQGENARAGVSASPAEGAQGPLSQQTTVPRHRDVPSDSAPRAAPAGGTATDADSHVSIPLESDPDLEAYLQEAEDPNGSGSGSPAASEAGDFDRYLEGFTAAGGNGEDHGGNGSSGRAHSHSGSKGDGSGGSSGGDDYEDLDEYLGAMASEEGGNDGGEHAADHA